MIFSSILLFLAWKLACWKYLSCKYQNAIQNIHIHSCRHFPSYIMGSTKVHSHWTWYFNKNYFNLLWFHQLISFTFSPFCLWFQPSCSVFSQIMGFSTEHKRKAKADRVMWNDREICSHLLFVGSLKYCEDLFKVKEALAPYTPLQPYQY